MGCGRSTNATGDFISDKMDPTNKNKDRNNLDDERVQKEHSDNQRHQQQLENNPNFFYNEELFVQSAVRQSIVESNSRGNLHQNDGEVYNNMLKDTIVLSKKEYDDIDRKKYEDELSKIKNDPIAMKNKIEGLLSKENVVKNNKKLPPLALASKTTNANKTRKDLSLIKAPILQDTRIYDSTYVDRNETDRHGNETESEVDIKEDNGMAPNDYKPSYNPQLLKDELNDDHLLSLGTNEYEYHEPGYNKHDDHYGTSDNMDLNDLMDELNDGPPLTKPKTFKMPLRLENNETYHDNYPENKRNSQDSFDDMMEDMVT
jgi:hypothetical protein